MRQFLILLAFITLVAASGCAHHFPGASQETMNPRTTIIPR